MLVIEELVLNFLCLLTSVQNNAHDYFKILPPPQKRKKSVMKDAKKFLKLPNQKKHFQYYGSMHIYIYACTYKYSYINQK